MVRQHPNPRSAPERTDWRRRALYLLFLAVAALALTVVLAFVAATREPIVRQATVGLADWPAGQPPLRLLLISDLHVAGPDMPPSRVARLVRQVNRLTPDVVLLAGDFVSDNRLATRRYSLDDAIAPLSAIRAPLGRFAVLGNHDHWRDATQARHALSEAGIRLLANSAARTGPLTIGGLDDDFTGHADVEATIASMQNLQGAKVVLSHSPDPFPILPDDVGLMVAGHTHCGQISLPIIGPPATMSRYGQRYACGIVRESGQTLIVSAGVGTSILPLRIGASSDIWVIEVGPLTAKR